MSVLPPRIITAPVHLETPALPEVPAAGKAPEGTMLNGASLCPQCHSLAYVQDGKCKSCRSCGYKDGGCGGINGKRLIPVPPYFKAEPGQLPGSALLTLSPAPINRK